MIFVTGGAGFIGSAFVRRWLEADCGPLVNIDKLTYAGNLLNLGAARDDPRHRFVEADIGDAALMADLLQQQRPAAIVHLAAETHVDRSIHGPAAFIETNVVGTHRLLEAACGYWQGLPLAEQATFRFLHVSTDEVYGSLAAEAAPCAEDARYAPSNPYAASKAAADHLVRAYYRTYGLPVLITNCSNNYGPYQYPEKLIPLAITHALQSMPIPVYGDGRNIRDWLHVDDHCEALMAVLARGRPGETYNVSAHNERENLSLIVQICDLIDDLAPAAQPPRRRELIALVADRPGHDWRYALSAAKLTRELGWRPRHEFAVALRRTVEWFMANGAWAAAVRDHRHAAWMQRNYALRCAQ